MIAILGLLLVLAVFAGPQLWVWYEFRRHRAERPDFPGTGGEFARYLLDATGLQAVLVERAERGDHYDPGFRAVRLSDGNLQGRSLTAVAVAAHEVGHAIQHRDGLLGRV